METGDMHLGDVTSLDDESLEAALSTTYAAMDRAHAVAVDLLVEVDRRRAWERTGCASLAAWLCSVVPSLSKAQARVEVRVARLLRDHTVVREALSGAALTASHAEVLASARNPRTQWALDRDDALLTRLGGELSVDEYRTALAHWRFRADVDGTKPDDPRANRLTITPVGGRFRLSGDLDGVAGAAVHAAVEAQVGRRYRAEGASERAATTPTQRRAHALVDLVTSDTTDPAGEAGVRTTVTVVCRPDDLTGDDGSDVVVQPSGAVLGPDTVRRLACAGGIARVVLAADGAVLDAGRTLRLPSGAQRRAVLARDRGCAVDGCDAAPWLCEIHHLIHWADGGRTDLDNLAMVCRFHHRRAHTNGWHLGRDPDGMLRCRPHQLSTPAA